MADRPRRTRPITGGSRRASIDLGGILGAAGVGGGTNSNPQFDPRIALQGAGAAPYDDPYVDANDPSSLNVYTQPYIEQNGFWRELGRAITGTPNYNAEGNLRFQNILNALQLKNANAPFETEMTLKQKQGEAEIENRMLEQKNRAAKELELEYGPRIGDVTARNTARNTFAQRFMLEPTIYPEFSPSLVSAAQANISKGEAEDENARTTAVARRPFIQRQENLSGQLAEEQTGLSLEAIRDKELRDAFFRGRLAESLMPVFRNQNLRQVSVGPGQTVFDPSTGDKFSGSMDKKIGEESVPNRITNPKTGEVMELPSTEKRSVYTNAPANVRKFLMPSQINPNPGDESLSPPLTNSTRRLRRPLGYTGGW